MSDELIQFVHRQQELPEKRSATERKKDFAEISKNYLLAKAKSQAGRCSQCGVPFCQVHCPLSNNIPDWLMLAATDRLKEAYELAASTNIFPEICGRICPQDKLCEGNCVIEQAGYGYVTIGSIEKFITEHAFAQDWVKPITPKTERTEKIAIIGAGPAGLSAAIELRKHGFQTHVFDRYDRAGGLMIYGIPNFKLEKSVMLRRQAWLEQSGVQFHFGIDVKANFHDLQKNHNAVLIATGVYRARAFNLTPPATMANQIISALPYLIRENRLELDKSDNNPNMNANNKHVVVIGGGDTAMDCVRTAIRQGAKSVTCLYRRSRAEMTGSGREVTHAEDEGVTFIWQSVVKEFIGKPNLTAITIQKTRTQTPTSIFTLAPQKQELEFVTGSEQQIPADMLILALGFEAEAQQELFQFKQLNLNLNGTIKVDQLGRTNIAGIYAAGDIVRGASLVVHAISDGMRVSRAIHKDLTTKKLEAA